MSLLEQARQFLNSRGILLDARSAKEFSEGQFDGSINLDIPLPPLSPVDIAETGLKIAALINFYGKDRPYIVFCKKGVRSSLVVSILRNYGIQNVIDLKGITMDPLKTLIESKGEL